MGNTRTAYWRGSVSFGVLWTASLSVSGMSRAQVSHSPACDSSSKPAHIFAPTLADSGKIFRGVLGPDGRELYFFKKVGSDPNAEDYRIFVSQLQGGAWSKPELLALGAEHSDLYPTLSADGRRLVFTSYRPVPGDTATKPSASLWYADLDGGKWSRPVPIRTATKMGSYHSQPVLQGDTLVFRRTSPDWRTSQTLVTHWNGHAYAAPKAFSPVEQWANLGGGLRVWGGIPGHDDSYVVLEVSELDPRTGRPSPSDLWASVRFQGRWTRPQPLGGGVNSAVHAETFPVISPNGCDLLFVKDFSTFYRVSLRSALAPQSQDARQ